jgi:hypothetical protein
MVKCAKKHILEIEPGEMLIFSRLQIQEGCHETSSNFFMATSNLLKIF